MDLAVNSEVFMIRQGRWLKRRGGSIEFLLKSPRQSIFSHGFYNFSFPLFQNSNFFWLLVDSTWWNTFRSTRNDLFQSLHWIDPGICDFHFSLTHKLFCELLADWTPDFSYTGLLMFQSLWVLCFWGFRMKVSILWSCSKSLCLTVRRRTVIFSVVLNFWLIGIHGCHFLVVVWNFYCQIYWMTHILEFEKCYVHWLNS